MYADGEFAHVKTIDMNKPLHLCIAAALLATACTFTMTSPKPPVYNEPVDSVRAQLRAVVICERFEVDGKENSTNGKPHSELDLGVINGRNIPQGDTLGYLGRTLAARIKHALKDTGAYEKYQVSFTTEEVSGSSTTRTSTRWTFLSKDL